MNSTILMLVCVPCAAVLAVVWFLVALNEKGINPFYEIFGRYRKQSLVGLVLLPIFVLGMYVFGSNKAPTNDVTGAGSDVTNGVPGEVSSPTNAPLMMMARGGGRGATRPTEYWLWRTGTNEVWNFDLMPEAHVAESWRLRGAAEDWTVCATTNLGPVVMTTDGRLVTTNGVFTAYDGQLAVVPEANWGHLGTNAPSRAWWAETPWRSTVFTWQNAFLGRDTNTPVSVQAEFTREGDFIYRYDLAATGTNLTSELYYRLRPEDMEWDDRDEDGLSTHDEVTEYHTDPGLVDSDGDGLPDYDEVWYYGTDPTTRSVPNEDIIARVTGSATNEQYRCGWQPGLDNLLTTLKLWDGFAADWPQGGTNLVYERTITLGTANGWQHYFLSSKESEAGDWDLRGLVLEWDDGAGNCGTALASPDGDSLPLSITNSTVTIRLRAIGPKIRCPKPMYLIGYAPSVQISGGAPVYDEYGDERGYRVEVGDDAVTLGVTIDRSHRPCKAALAPAELAIPGLAGIGASSGGTITYDGNESGGTITVSAPGCCQLPAFTVDDPFTPDPRPRLMAGNGGSQSDGGGKWILCLDPSVDFSGDHKFVSTGFSYDSEKGDYCIEYYYPLDSKCLWRSWQQSESGSWNCSCEPEVKAGGGADGLPFIETSYEISSDRTEATGIVKAFGQEIWRGTATHSWRDVGEGGGISTGSELLSNEDECDDCGGGCADGDCDKASGTGLNSVKFRLSLGMPRQGQHSGFVFFESENPVVVTMGLFEVKTRDDAYVTDETSGTERAVTCYDLNGRNVAMAPMPGGVRLTVTVRETEVLEDVWEVFNVGGNTNVIRIVQKSRLNNVMSDETYACDEDGVWSKTDNITGIVETLERVDRINDPADGKLYETRTTYDADGNQLDSVYTESSRIGVFGNAVLRETYWEQDTGSQTRWRAAEYWNDAAHKDRHGQLKLLTGNCVAWTYHDYDVRGFETLRVEQRNGSAVPTAFPEVIAGDLYWTSGLADAFVTVFDYTPFTGDDRNPNDVDKVRCETRFVVRNGRATRIARTWTRYTHTWCNGYNAVMAETWRAASATATRMDSANAYSYVITYDEAEGYTPLILRGEIAEEQDENGVQTYHYVWEDWATVVEETHKWYDGCEFPTYEVAERDLAFGNEIRRATYLSDSYELIDEAISTYDEKQRLRSTVYSDGTSETNAWSCCRKLWSRDREGRKTLRSAVTGQDRLYYAEEEVWLRELSTNGEHKVTQHFFDGLGREIETVSYSAAVAGEATDSAASDGKVATVATKSYPNGGDDSSVTVDARGRVTTEESADFVDRTECAETMYADEQASAPDLQTLTTEWRNGMRVTEKAWGTKWTREIEREDYDANGCVVRYEMTASSDCGMVTNRVTVFDFLGRTVREVTPNGTTETAYHGATERTDTTTLTAGAVTRTSTAVYNELGEEVGSELDGITSRTDETYEMDMDGSWWKVTRSERSDDEMVDSSSERREQLTGRASDVISRRIEIDADGVVEETVERRGAAEGERVTVVSNAVTGVRTQTRRYGVVVETVMPDELQQSTYDAFGRCVGRARIPAAPQATQNGVPREAYAYNGVGDLVAKFTYTNGTDFVTETYEYDTYGRRVSSVDALGNETETRYDAVGNVVEQSGATWPVGYGYDTAGRRISLSTTKDGRIWDVTRWTYDPATGKCTAKRYPDGSQVAYSLTPDGLPLQTTKASGVWSRNAYDEKRQLIGTESNGGAGDAGFEYDAFGKMTAASNGVAAYAYARHRGGIVTNEWVDLDGDVQIVRTVDGFGRLSGRGVYGQDSQAIAYDGQGRVAAVSSGAAVATYAYGAGGVDAGYVIALNDGATVEHRVVRDAYRSEQIVAVSNFVNGAAVGGESYARDAKGRIVERVENVERVEQFGYDAVGQVVEVANYQLPSTNYQLTSYSYDLIGNIAGAAALVYTADGEVTGLNGLTFGYDSASRLTTVATGDVTIATYGYDAFDRRVRKTTAEATTTYLYDGWNLIREEIAGTNGTTDVIEYYWGKDISGSLDTAGGIGGLLYLKHNGTVYVPLYDASDNVTAYVDASGNVVAEFAYDAFGNTVAEDGTLVGVFRFKYSTKYHDAETGLIYYGYRYYAPTTARWLTRDPLEEQGGLNLHCFCENDGVNKVDWLGQVPEPTANEVGRQFWRQIAKDLRDILGYKLSAMLLERSINNPTSPWVFDKRSGLPGAVQESYEYRNDYQKVIKEFSDDKYHTITHSGISFNGDGDLYSAISSANIQYKGRIKHSNQNRECIEWIDLGVAVEGPYAYDEQKFKDLLEHVDYKDKAQNARNAMGDYKDAIKNYDWKVTFREEHR